jgi:hypothetical protein
MPKSATGDEENKTAEETAVLFRICVNTLNARLREWGNATADGRPLFMQNGPAANAKKLFAPEHIARIKERMECHVEVNSSSSPRKRRRAGSTTTAAGRTGASRSTSLCGLI